jgi:uncharacterized SAM-dependent methyltransferase
MSSAGTLRRYVPVDVSESALEAAALLVFLVHRLGELW